MKKIIIGIIAIIAVIAIIYYLSPQTTNGPMQEKDVNTLKTDEPSQVQISDWRKAELIDVRTSEKFMISDFNSKPVLLESFAVWCPTCRKQQDQIKSLHEEINDIVISISLDTDPNEDESKVLEHINRHGYNWFYAVSPSILTQALIDEFGISFVNAPGAPVVLICAGGEARMLDSGVKSKDELKDEINKGC